MVSDAAGHRWNEPWKPRLLGTCRILSSTRAIGAVRLASCKRPLPRRTSFVAGLYKARRMSRSGDVVVPRTGLLGAGISTAGRHTRPWLDDKRRSLQFWISSSLDLIIALRCTSEQRPVLGRMIPSRGLSPRTSSFSVVGVWMASPACLRRCPSRCLRCPSNQASTRRPRGRDLLAMRTPRASKGSNATRRGFVQLWLPIYGRNEDASRVWTRSVLATTPGLAASKYRQAPFTLLSHV